MAQLQHNMWVTASRTAVLHLQSRTTFIDHRTFMGRASNRGTSKSEASRSPKRILPLNRDRASGIARGSASSARSRNPLPESCLMEASNSEVPTSE
jgi:hypothetical protein